MPSTGRLALALAVMCALALVLASAVGAMQRQPAVAAPRVPWPAVAHAAPVVGQQALHRLHEAFADQDGLGEAGAASAAVGVAAVAVAAAAGAAPDVQQLQVVAAVVSAVVAFSPFAAQHSAPKRAREEEQEEEKEAGMCKVRWQCPVPRPVPCPVRSFFH